MQKNVSIRDVERELTRQREELSEPGAAPVLRTSSMTHLAWVPERWEQAAVETLAGLHERHPSRGILLFPRPDSDRDELDADVDVRCFRNVALERDVCAEVVTVWLNGPRSQAPATVVLPLLISDLPVFLRWRGDPPFGSQPLDQLLGVVDRLIVDSSEWKDPRSELPRLAELVDRVAVSDIAWARTQPWREAVAGLWPEPAEAETLRVAGPRAEALLLARWLGARLSRRIAFEHEPADAIERVEVNGVEARPARPDTRSPSDLLSEQLDLFGRDPIYEEALCFFSPALT